jgi:predicted metal-dependent phosphoesterase TrpH
MVDLHCHTDASDGSDTPSELIDNALRAGVTALSITDHDTFAGYYAAKPYADEKGLDLLCGIELSTKYQGQTVHLLGYFPGAAPAEAFTTWLLVLQERRRERNFRLVENLRKVNVKITMEEVEALGKTMAGRPHFAKILMKKGYVKTMQEAFDKYLAEHGRAFTEREEVPLEEGIKRMRAAGGIPVIAHPVRLGRRTAAEEAEWIETAKEMGMLGLEVRHSDHDAAAVARYTALAARLGLLTTGGSDYHGTYKPDIKLGTGKFGNVSVPMEWVDRLRA